MKFMTKVGIDIRCLSDGKKTGVGEYALSLLPSIFENNKNIEFVLFFNSFKKSEVDFSWINKFPNVKVKIFRFPNKILNFSLWYFSYPKIDKLLGGVDIFFMPNITFVSLQSKVKLLLTVHDLSFERYPEFFSKKRRLWHWFINPKKIAKRANKIIAVSDSTRKDLISLYGIKEEKITVILNAISDKFRIFDRNDPNLIRVKEKYSLPYKFIFFLGTFEPRKNIRSLIMAFDHFRTLSKQKDNKEFSNYKLVLAGKRGWLFQEILDEIEKADFREEIICLDFIDEEDKSLVYNLASVFVYPSFFEGFGFPPLEAMACGVPVIISNTSSLPEVVGESAVMINPDKPDEIRIALEQILGNSDFRKKIIMKGKKQAEKFSWRKNAESVKKELDKMACSC